MKSTAICFVRFLRRTTTCRPQVTLLNAIVVAVLLVVLSERCARGSIMEFQAGEEVSVYDSTSIPSEDGFVIFGLSFPQSQTVTATVGGSVAANAFIYEETPTSLRFSWDMHFTVNTAGTGWAQTAGLLSFQLSKDADFHIVGILETESPLVLDQQVIFNSGHWFKRNSGSPNGASLDLDGPVDPSDAVSGITSGFLPAGERIFQYGFFVAGENLSAPAHARGRLSLEFEYVPIPEPSSVVLASLASLVIVGWHCRYAARR